LDRASAANRTGLEERIYPLDPGAVEKIVPRRRGAGVDSGGADLVTELGGRLVAQKLDPRVFGEQVGDGQPRPRGGEIDRPAAPLDRVSGEGADQRLDIAGDGAEIRLGAVPLEHGELDGVVAAALVGAKALAERVDPLEFGHQKALELKLRRGRQVGAARLDRLDVDLEAGGRHQNLRLDLDKAALAKERPGLREQLRACGQATC
jgi:hypothetical protein